MDVSKIKVLLKWRPMPSPNMADFCAGPKASELIRHVQLEFGTELDSAKVLFHTNDIWVEKVTTKNGLVVYPVAIYTGNRGREDWFFVGRDSKLTRGIQALAKYLDTKASIYETRLNLVLNHLEAELHSKEWVDDWF